MLSTKFFALFTPHFYSHQLSLDKVHTWTQTVTRWDSEATCESQCDLNCSEQAELTYPPPKSMVLTAESKNRVLVCPKLHGHLEFDTNSINR